MHITNAEFFLKPELRGQGLGTSIFAAQVWHAAAHGVEYLDCHAAKLNPQDPAKPHNGYYTWPLLGYNAYLDDIGQQYPGVAAKARKLFPGADTILDVMATEAGAAWWKQNGVDIEDARFELAAGSRSREVLADYLVRKKRSDL